MSSPYLPPYVAPYKPLSNITPFTYRDGLTYLEVLSELRQYITETVVPFVNTNFDALGEAFEVETNILIEAVNTAIETQSENVDAQLLALTTYVNEQVAIIIDDSVTVQDPVVAGILADDESLTRVALDVIILDSAVPAGATAGEAAGATAGATAGEAAGATAGEAAGAIAGAIAGEAAAALHTDLAVNAIVIDTDSDTRQTLDTLYASTSVNVEDFGATGDGVTDDSVAIQSAIDALTNGGLVTFEHGKVYYVSAALIVGSNTTLDGNFSTLRKFESTDDRCIIANLSEEYATGYGAGGENIVIKNFNIRGDYSITPPDYKDICVSFNHVSNLTIKGCNFSEGMRNSHYLDLLGCNDVTITENTFMGMNPIADREYIEAIQLDYSVRNRASLIAEPDTAYDGLPTIDVIVTENIFTTYDDGVTVHPMPNPIGNHGGGSLESDIGYVRNVLIANNIFRGFTPNDDGSDIGWVRFPAWKDVIVKGNLFQHTGEAGSGFQVAINIFNTTTVIPDSDAGSSTPSSVSYARASVGILVTENIFDGFNNTDDVAIIQVNGSSTTLGIVISNNIIRNSAQRGVRVAGGARVSIIGNSITTTKWGISTSSSTVNANDNDINSGSGIFISGGSDSMVNNNRIIGADTAIRFANCNNGMTLGNFIKDHTVAAIMIGANADSGTTFDVEVSGNIARSSMTPTNSLLVGTKATRCHRYGNTWRDGGTVSDTGSASVTTATDKT